VSDGRQARMPRRPALLHMLAGVAGVGLVGVRPAAAQVEAMTVSGGGVNVKQMPAPTGNETVPLRESFSFDGQYAQCIVEDNPAAFAMDTHELGRVVIEPHTFFMAMHSHEMAMVSITRGQDGKRVAKLAGQLGCATEAGTADLTVGSRDVTEPAFFEIETVDGGRGGGVAGDSFAFTVFFDPGQAPVNHAIFGPKATFTGTMEAGEITIGPPVTLPLLG
jgi:hypothetical protein